MPTREELNKLARMVRGARLERILKMTRDEKYAELKEFFHVAQEMELDIDQLEKDRKLLGFTDEDLTQAIMICQAVVGKAFNTLPMSVEEFKNFVPESEWAKQRLAFWNRCRGIRRNTPYPPEVGRERTMPEPPNWRSPDSKGSNLDRAVRVGEYLDKKDK